MAKNYVKSLLIGSVCLSLGLSFPVSAQKVTADDSDSFTPENAILDTSILFAIGAREARQELRGSFGWPTFQEGLVEGVYFRFDPDGYGILTCPTGRKKPRCVYRQVPPVSRPDTRSDVL